MRTFIRKKKQPFGVLGIVEVNYQGDNFPFFIGGPQTGRRYRWDKKGKQPFDQQDWDALSKDQQSLFGRKAKVKPEENKE